MVGNRVDKIVITNITVDEGTYIANFSEQWLEQLKANSDIVDVIGKFVYLQKKGAKYWACCPFHHEKTPSFCVNATEQYYHCFGCGESGNVINFLMMHEKMSYVEAIEWLAKRANMQLPDNETPEEKKNRLKREKALEVMRLAAHFYYNNLSEPNGSAARAYLAERKLSAATVKEYGMGFSTDYYSLPKYLMSKGYGKETLQYAGLITETDDGKILDFFANRLIIPIINAMGQVIAFGGRTLIKGKQPKYKNTSGTPLFDKRRTIFGINVVKKLQQKETVNDLILVEGYMDVISLSQAGIKNVVASMGTSLTAEQCQEIRKYVPVVYVSFDGDAAGQMATWRSLDMLAEARLEVKVITMPEGLDPDDTVKQRGKEGFLALKNEALPLNDFKIKSLAKRYNLETTDGKNKFAKASLEILSKLDPIAKDLYIKVVSDMSGLSAESVKNSLVVQATKKVPPKVAPTATDAAIEQMLVSMKGRVVAGRFILSSVFAAKDYVMQGDLSESLFDYYEPHKAVCAYVYKCIELKNLPKVGDLFDILPEAKQEITKIVDAITTVPNSEQKKYYEQCLSLLKKNELQKRQENILERLKTTQDPKETELLKEELRKLLRR